VFTPLAARIASSGRVDPRLQIGAGFLCIGIANWLLAGVTTPESPFSSFFGPLVLSGIGLSQVFVPLSLVVFGSVPGREVPKASAMFNLARQLGGSVATAVLITLLDRSAAVHQTRIAADMTERRAPVVAYVSDRGGPLSPTALAGLNNVVANQALVMGYADTSRDSAIVTLLLTPLVILLKKPTPKKAA
jgi:DHA2 family multidrug resistance protein